MSSDPLIGRKLGDYTIRSILGQGGMARVYRGLDEKLNRYAAIKIIDSADIREEEADYKMRFENEARAIARLDHPNIVRVYQFGQSDTLYYMAMSYIDGRDLRAILKQVANERGSIPRAQVLSILRDVGSALDYAHRQAVIHRDVKPSNIMIAPDGRAILTDFGLALSVAEGTRGTTFGSAHYVAPEQAVNSAQAVPQSDLYSLGIVLYELLTSRVPFDDPSAVKVAMKHITDTAAPPSRLNPTLNPLIDRVVLKALEKDPGRRFQNCGAMVHALEQAFEIDQDRPATEASVRAANAQPAGVSTAKPPQAAPTTLALPPEPEEEAPATESRALPPPITDDQPTITDSRASAGARLRMQDAQRLQSAQRNKRLRPWWVIASAVVVFGVGALLLSSLASPAPAAEPTAATHTAPAVGVVATATDQPAASATVVSATRQRAASATAQPTDPATPLPTHTATERPAETAPTGVALSPTALAAASVSASITPGSLPQAGGEILLQYNDDVLTLYNVSSQSQDISNLVFVDLAQSSRRFASNEWAETARRPITQLPPGDCVQVVRGDRILSLISTRPADCEFVQSWRQIAIQRAFWLTPTVERFSVSRGDRTLDECSAAAGECRLTLAEPSG